MSGVISPIPLRWGRGRGIMNRLREASEGEARRLTHRGPSCPSRECRTMGDVRDPGEDAPLARVHELRSRTPGASSRETAGDEAAAVRAPSLLLSAEHGVVELDGRTVADFDAADAFVALHGLDLGVAAEAMEIDPVPSAGCWCTPPPRPRSWSPTPPG